MAEYEVRPLEAGDFDTISALEETLFGSAGQKTLGPFYVRLCCDFYNDTSFLVFADGKPAGYILAFVRGREAYCSTLAILPEFQRTRATHHLIRRFVRAIASRCDTLWFTVEEENRDARKLHATLGAREVEVRPDFFGPGAARIVSVIERAAFERLRLTMARLEPMPPPEPSQVRAVS
jgi:ribosomal protein S18 acetylase RimI-like enzyme